MTRDSNYFKDFIAKESHLDLLALETVRKNEQRLKEGTEKWAKELAKDMATFRSDNEAHVTRKV